MAVSWSLTVFQKLVWWNPYFIGLFWCALICVFFWEGGVLFFSVHLFLKGLRVRWVGPKGHLTWLNSVQTRCIVKGEAQKSPLFWRFSGGFCFSQDRLFSRNSTRKPLNLIKSPIFTNTPCKTACLYNAPSMHTLDWPLSPPYYFLFVLFLFSFLFEKKTCFPPRKGHSCLFFSVSLCFSLAFSLPLFALSLPPSLPPSLSLSLSLSLYLYLYLSLSRTNTIPTFNHTYTQPQQPN